ncbi:MAG: Gfo/Idh/MocA family oxidoreductase, partial [Cyclobacteriaceae bacterium]
ILQLRLHPSIIALREKIKNGSQDKTYDVDLTYITSRGHWYHHSWKGDISKSGGIATNIGIHFFDMLIWVFGSVKKNEVTKMTEKKAEGSLTLQRAYVNWMLSVDAADLPEKEKQEGKRTFRSLTLEGKEIEFSDGFTDLHTKSYQNILDGNGFGLSESLESIGIAHKLR